MRAEGNAQGVQTLIPTQSTIDPVIWMRKRNSDTWEPWAVVGSGKPVGAIELGWDPNGIYTGVWEQWPEGTFIMNTIGGADASGGSNTAITVSHTHNTGNSGNHGHNVSDPGHKHNVQGATDNSNQGSRIGISSRSVQNTPNTDIANTGISIGNGGNHSHNVVSTGNSGTNANKPLYKGIAIWERTS
jgi:hypothetical protein